jgi:hypothetical protein
MTTTTTKLYAHRKLDIVAPATYWYALGFQPCEAGEGEDVGTVSYHRVGSLDDVLILGIAKTEAHDEKVLVWALEEVQRRKEAQTTATAIAREAEGLQALAKSIRETTDNAFLSRLFGHLSEKTRYAIQQQLKRKPL